MMHQNSRHINCPICMNYDQASCTLISEKIELQSLFECTTCGRFAATRTCLDDYLINSNSKLNSMKRARLSHYTRTNHDSKNQILVDDNLIAQVLEADSLINPAMQAKNIIQYIGKKMSEDGLPISQFGSELYAISGSPTNEFAGIIVENLSNLDLISCKVNPAGLRNFYFNITLTLAGWEKYLLNKSGKFAGNFGFMALQFGDLQLENLTKFHIKPYVLKKLNFEILDVRDNSKAGVIDNLIRTNILDSAFVIADLTHENRGAYWEAGFAEGAGKPVIYICQKDKFHEEKTHFDTNHSTTVLWDMNEIDYFLEDLVATIRRSLNLFDRQ